MNFEEEKDKRKGRLAEECEKLDMEEERAFAEEWFVGEVFGKDESPITDEEPKPYQNE
jgi:hypothetical protein